MLLQTCYIARKDRKKDRNQLWRLAAAAADDDDDTTLLYYIFLFYVKSIYLYL
jgi:hypothetical protein